MSTTTTTTTQEKLFLEGIFVDPITSDAQSIKMPSLTIGEIVGSLTWKVVGDVNRAFELDQTANPIIPRDCRVRTYPFVSDEDCDKPISQVLANQTEKRMTVLISPPPSQRAVIQNHLIAKSATSQTLEALLSHVQKDIQKLLARVDSVEAVNKKFDVDNKKLFIDNKKLLARVDSLETDNRKLIADNLIHEEDIQHLKDTTQKLKENHRKELSKTEQRVQQMHKETIRKLNEQRDHLENQNTRLNERVDTLEKQNVEIQKDLGVHSRCFEILIPLHLRVLLDMARETVLSTLGFRKWDDFVQGRDLEVIIEDVDRGLANSRNKPSRGAIDYLCTVNEVRKRGNTAAHTATKQEIARAYDEWTGQSDKGFLAELYRFRFDEDIP